VVVTDDDADWSAEDSSATASGARRSQVGSLLGVRRRRAAAADGYVHSHRSLAGLHLVRHRQLRAAEPASADRLARRAGRADQAALSVPRQQFRRSSDPVQVHNGSLLHVQQPHFGRLRQRGAQHQLRENLLRLRHAHRMLVTPLTPFHNNYTNNNDNNDNNNTTVHCVQKNHPFVLQYVSKRSSNDLHDLADENQVKFLVTAIKR